MTQDREFKMKVKSSSNAKALASSIKKAILDDEKIAVLDAIGASAVNQAFKACAICRSYVATAGYDLIVRPAFSTTTINGESKTVARFFVSKN